MSYFTLGQLLEAIGEPNRSKIRAIVTERSDQFRIAAGSSHNHQAWEGGYLHHVLETMNLAMWMYTTCPRPLPFSLSDALVVMFLHDIEKPAVAELVAAGTYSKADRRQYRADVIKQYGIELSEDQLNALRYVEGVPDSEYTPGERTMGRLAAFCHCCDILSARLWWDRGSEAAW